MFSSSFQRGFIGCPASGVLEVDDLDDVILDSLEAPDGKAELDAGVGVFEGHVEDLLAGADLVG